MWVYARCAVLRAISSCSRFRHPCPPRTSRSCRWRRWPPASQAAKGRCGRAKGFSSSATTVRTGSTNTFRERRPKSIGKAPTGPTATRWIGRDACTIRVQGPAGHPDHRKGRIDALLTGSKANGSTRPTTSWCGAMDTSISPTPCTPCSMCGTWISMGLPCHAERPDRGDRADADAAQRRHAVAGWQDPLCRQ